MRTKIASLDEREAIAKKLASLSPGVELNPSPKHYFSLDIGSRPNKNAVIIPKTAKHVSFYIHESSLVQRLIEAGFTAEPFPDDPKRLFNRNKFKISPFSIERISENEALFRDVLNHSLSVIQNRRARN